MCLGSFVAQLAPPSARRVRGRSTRPSITRPQILPKLLRLAPEILAALASSLTK